MGVNKAKIFTITSSSGGTGKTNTTLNLAGILSLKKKKTLILDFDLYFGSIGAMLNVPYKNDLYRMYEDISNSLFTTLDDYIVPYNDYIDVLCSPLDPRLARNINATFINTVISFVISKYDVVLIDTSDGMNDINLISFDYSDSILYVINNDIMSLKNMKSALEIYNDMEFDNIKIILNNSTNKDKNSFSMFEIQKLLNHDIDFIIPASFYQKKYDNYVMDGKLFTIDKKIRKNNYKGIKAFEYIIDTLLKEFK